MVEIEMTKDETIRRLPKPIEEKEEDKPEEAQPEKQRPKPRYALLIEEFQEDGKTSLRFNSNGFVNSFELIGWVNDRLPNASTIVEMMRKSGSG